MKKVLLTISTILLGSSLTTTALASPAAIEGTYSSTKIIAAFGYQNEEECAESPGKWEDDTCLIEVEDKATIYRMENTLRMDVETSGHNVHSCGFNGSAELVNATTLIASEPTQEWDPEQGKLVNKTCQVKATFSKDYRSVSIEPNDACRSLCGTNAELYIEKATKN